MSPLGEDNGILLLPLQTATLGNLAGLRGDVVLRGKRGEPELRYRRLVPADSSASVISPTSPFTVHSTIGRRDFSYNDSIAFQSQQLGSLNGSMSALLSMHSENGPIYSDLL